MTHPPHYLRRPPWGAMSTSAPRNRFGQLALLLAVIGFGFGWTPLTMPLALGLGTLAVLLGVLGCVRLHRGVASNFGVTVAGLALGAGVVVLAVLALLG